MKKPNALISLLVVLSLSLMLVPVTVAQDEPPADGTVVCDPAAPAGEPGACETAGDAATEDVQATEEVTAEPTPTDTPEPTPTDTPEPTPTDTPEPTPTDTPEVPTDTPEVPTDTPEVPTDTPEVPTDTPEVPTDTPEVPTDTPEVPTDTPEVPTDTPEVPTDTPEVPTDVPTPTEEQPAPVEEEAIEEPVEEEIIEEAEEAIIEPDAQPIEEPLEALAPASSAIDGSAATSKSLSTNFTMVNLGTAQASVALEYRKTDGSNWPVGSEYAGPFTLAANGGSKQLRQYFDTAMSTGKGSVVLSSDQPLGAVAQIQARNQVPSQGAYSGATGGASQVYVPLVARQGTSASGAVNAEIVVQNTGTGSVSVAVDFYNNSDGSLVFTKNLGSIPGGTSKYYDVSTETGLPTNWFGSAVVRTTAGGEVAVVANLFMGADLMQTYNGFPASQATTKWSNPSFFSRLTNGLSTVMTVQNVSASDWGAGTVVAQCVRTQGGGPGSFAMSNTSIVKKNAPYNFNPVTNLSIPGNWVGSCTVTTLGNSVLIVQMRYVGAPYPEGAAFNALASNGTAKKCSAPLIAKRLGNGFATVFTVQNLSSSSSASVTFNYKVNAAESSQNINVTVGPYTIPAGASLQHNHRLPGNGGSGSLVHNLPDGWVGSVVVTSSNQPIDCYAQLTFYSNKNGDTFMAHNGFTY
jgi:hypothetical protein